MTSRLEKLEALNKAATKGPWRTNHNASHVAFRPTPNGSLGDYHFAKVQGWDGEVTANGLLIAEARNALPALLKVAGWAQTFIKNAETEGGVEGAATTDMYTYVNLKAALAELEQGG